MMKKITTCFLVMAIVAGCTQVPVEPEKPVDPPVIEQPQKPVEQEKPEEETKVKKIDESKDWVYVESRIDLPIEPSITYPYVVQNLLDEGTLYIDVPAINIQSDEIAELNRQIRANQEALYDELGEFEGVPTFAFSTANIYHFEDIYSLVIRTRRTAYNDIPRPEYMIYNIDIKEGRILDNFDLFTLLDFNIEQAEKNVLELLEERNISACEIEDVNIEPAIPCYPHTGETLNNTMKAIFPVDENARIFVDNDGNLIYYPDLYKVSLDLSEFKIN